MNPLGDTPLSSQYPGLYSIVRHKNVLVAQVMNTVPLNLQFRRAILGDKRDAWLHLVARLMQVTITDQADVFKWKLTTNGKFSVKTLHADYMNGHTRFLHKYLWKLRIPLKIKIFLWFLNKKVLLTKDNLAKRRWTGCKKCVFCDTDESVEHLFISCHFVKNIWRLVHFTFNITPPTSIANMFGTWLNGVEKHTKARIRIGVAAFLWAIWNCRNDIVFNRSQTPHFLQVVLRATHWIQQWSLLLPVAQQDHMDSGCTRMMAVVRAIFCQNGWRQAKRIDV